MFAYFLALMKSCFFTAIAEHQKISANNFFLGYPGTNIFLCHSALPFVLCNKFLSSLVFSISMSPNTCVEMMI